MQGNSSLLGTASLYAWSDGAQLPVWRSSGTTALLALPTDAWPLATVAAGAVNAPKLYLQPIPGPSGLHSATPSSSSPLPSPQWPPAAFVTPVRPSPLRQDELPPLPASSEGAAGAGAAGAGVGAEAGASVAASTGAGTGADVWAPHTAAGSTVQLIGAGYPLPCATPAPAFRSSTSAAAPPMCPALVPHEPPQRQPWEHRLVKRLAFQLLRQRRRTALGSSASARTAWALGPVFCAWRKWTRHSIRKAATLFAAANTCRRASLAVGFSAWKRAANHGTAAAAAVANPVFKALADARSREMTALMRACLCAWRRVATVDKELHVVTTLPKTSRRAMRRTKPRVGPRRVKLPKPVPSKRLSDPAPTGGARRRAAFTVRDVNAMHNCTNVN